MIDRDPTLITFQQDAPSPTPWVCLSEPFTYLHPLDGKEEAYRFEAYGATAAEAHAKAKKVLDWFMGDRGHCIVSITDFTADELAKVKP